MKNKFFWIIVAILLITIGWYYAGKKTSVNMPMEEENKLVNEESVLVAPMAVSENAVLIDNQAPGISVKISFVSFTDGGYVVIHEEKNGVSGAILGSVGHLLPGESKDLEVMLSRKSVDKENLFVILHKDNGDGVFKAIDDAPIKDDEGNIIMMKFMIDEAATEIKNQ